jgi:hypothetical protein
MPVREFLRGGYRTIRETTVISRRGYPLFTVWPGPPRYRDEPSTSASAQGGRPELQVVLQAGKDGGNTEAER